jgi:ADP-ribose pyrophosphatase
MPRPPQEEPTLESRRAFEGKLVNLRVDTVRLPNGGTIRREIVEHGDCVCIVPLDRNGNVILVRQYRKAVESHLLEVPAGGIDPGEDAEAAAHRELREETGYRAREMSLLSYFWTTPGYCTEGMYAYLASGLETGPQQHEEDEAIEVVKMPLSDVPDLVARGVLQDAKSIAALLLAAARVDGSG